MGGADKIVEVDETFIGKLEGAPNLAHPGPQWRNVVLTLVTRGGNARSFHVDGTTIAALLPVIRANIQTETYVMTDEATWYRSLGATFDTHDTVNHAKDEYVRRDWTWHGGKLHTVQVHTNTVEGYFSIFKRGMKGVYQHCKEKHLHRYLAEFDFRYNTRTSLGYSDLQRAELVAAGIKGKHLTYRRPNKTSQIEAH